MRSNAKGRIVLYVQPGVQVYEFKSRNILALWLITSIHLQLSQHVLHSGSSECSLSQLSWGEGGVTPRTSQQFITRPDNHQVQGRGRSHTGTCRTCRLERSQFGITPCTIMADQICGLNEREFALIGSDTFQTVETRVALQTALNNVGIPLS